MEKKKNMRLQVAENPAQTTAPMYAWTMTLLPAYPAIKPPQKH